MPFVANENHDQSFELIVVDSASLTLSNKELLRYEFEFSYNDNNPDDNIT